MNQQHYTFGDNHLAARRLELLAEVFEPTTRVFLACAMGQLTRRPERALDLGCGPGLTTELLSEVVGADETIGLDRSPAYVALSRGRTSARLRFFEADVALSPYPIGAVDFVYARHLLTHLPHPATALCAFAAALRPGGVLALEETAYLRSAEPIFRDYYGIVEAMQLHYGQRMYIGQELGEIVPKKAGELITFRVVPTKVDAQRMGQLHSLNLRTFAKDPFVRESFSDDFLATLEKGITEVASGVRRVAPIDVGIGQVLFRRGVEEIANDSEREALESA